MSTRIIDYYNKHHELEKDRLFRDAYHGIEFEITKRFIAKYLNHQLTIADVGGGPGHYTQWLLSLGHTVALVDPASEQLARAEQFTYVNEKNVPNQFTDAYFAHPDDIPKLFQQEGINLECTFSCEGISSFMDEKSEIIFRDEVAWKRFLDLLELTATEPSILGSGEHSIYIGRKL